MSKPAITGLHHVKFPVSDLATGLAWFERVFGFRTALEFEDDDGVVRGVAGSVPGLAGAEVALRQTPEYAKGFAGFDPICFAIADRSAAEAWASWLDELGIDHSPVVDTPFGSILSLNTPDGIEIRLYSFPKAGSRPETATPMRVRPGPTPLSHRTGPS